MPIQVERAFTIDDVQVKGHEVDLVAVPYNAPTVVRDRNPDTDTYGPPYREQWAPGVFRHAVKAAHRVKLATGTHKDAWARRNDAMMGHGLELVERDDVLRGRFTVIDSSLGEHLVARLKDGDVRGVSIGAGVLRSRNDDGIVTRTLATLDHVLLTDKAQIPGAEVLAVRDDPDSAMHRYWAKYMTG